MTDTVLVEDEAATEETGLRHLYRFVGAAEGASEHPLAKAVVRHAQAIVGQLAPPSDFQAIAGQGVRCTVGGHAVLVGNRLLMQAHSVDVPPPLASSMFYHEQEVEP